MRRWVEEGPDGLDDRKRGRPEGVREADLQAILAVKKLSVLGEAGWLKAIKLEEYAPRNGHRPQALQGALFPYASVLL